MLFSLSLMLLTAVSSCSALPARHPASVQETLEARAADGITLNPYPNKPRLTFRSDGTFKLTVFSDLHFGENPWDDWGPVQDINSIKLMNTVLPSEKPDYVLVQRYCAVPASRH